MLVRSLGVLFLFGHSCSTNGAGDWVLLSYLHLTCCCILYCLLSAWSRASSVTIMSAFPRFWRFPSVPTLVLPAYLFPAVLEFLVFTTCPCILWRPLSATMQVCFYHLHPAAISLTVSGLLWVDHFFYCYCLLHHVILLCYNLFYISISVLGISSFLGRTPPHCLPTLLPAPPALDACGRSPQETTTACTLHLPDHTILRLPPSPCGNTFPLPACHLQRCGATCGPVAGTERRRFYTAAISPGMHYGASGLHYRRGGVRLA